jgi:hypothetical protein
MSLTCIIGSCNLRCREILILKKRRIGLIGINLRGLTMWLEKLLMLRGKIRIGGRGLGMLVLRKNKVLLRSWGRLAWWILNKWRTLSKIIQRLLRSTLMILKAIRTCDTSSAPWQLSLMDTLWVLLSISLPIDLSTYWWLYINWRASGPLRIILLHYHFIVNRRTTSSTLILLNILLNCLLCTNWLLLVSYIHDHITSNLLIIRISKYDSLLLLLIRLTDNNTRR